MKIRYASGLEESLAFAPLSISGLYQFVDCLVAGDTPRLVALQSRRSADWVNSLDLDCFGDLAAAFIAENFPKAARLAQKDPVAAMKLGPFLSRSLEVLSSLPSPASAPTPASAAPTGSDSPSAPPPPASAAPTTPPAAPASPAGSAASSPSASASAPSPAST